MHITSSHALSHAYRHFVYKISLIISGQRYKLQCSSLRNVRQFVVTSTLCLLVLLSSLATYFQTPSMFIFTLRQEIRCEILTEQHLKLNVLLYD
jgi:hypothetical protein